MSKTPVFVRVYSDTYIAHIGKGRSSKRCSCTSSAEFAVRRVAAKYFVCAEEAVAVERVNAALWYVSCISEDLLGAVQQFTGRKDEPSLRVAAEISML